MVQRNLAGGAAVEESALVESRLTGETREVDVVLRGTVAGQPIVVGVEATSGRRRATVEWVEQMLGKHADLPTDKLILVSEGGFAKAAKVLAERKGAVAMYPELLERGDAEARIVGSLNSVWAKAVESTPTNARLTVIAEDGSARDFVPTPETPIYDADGEAVGTAWELVNAAVATNTEGVTKQIMEQAATSGGASYDLSLAYQGQLEVFVRADNDALERIDRLDISVVCKITVAEVPLAHHRLGEVPYAWGIAPLGEQDVHVVLTEHAGEARGSFKMKARRSR